MINLDKTYYKIMAGIFIAFIFIMAILNILNPVKAFSSSENRVLQQMPKLTSKHIFDGSFTKDFESYISDQFFMRDNWVTAKSTVEVAIGKKDSNGVFLGKDGYLFQTFSDKDEELNKKMEAINSFATANENIKVNFMLVPDSIKVLADKLPKYATPEDQLTYINKTKVKLNSKVNFIDAYVPLMAKNNEDIYYKTDHHWTSKGAFYAYNAVSKDLGFVPHDASYFDIKQVTDSFYGTSYSKGGFRDIKPDSIEFYIPKISETYEVKYYDTNKQTTSLYNMAALDTKDKYGAFLDGNHSLIHIGTNNNSGKSIVLIKDSYANSLIPFLTGNYSDIYVVDFRFYTDSISKLIKENKIQEMLILYNVNTFSEDTGIESIVH